MPEVTANGLRMNVQLLHGSSDDERPTVVLLHGLVLDNLSSFYYTIAPPIVRAGHDVLLYDQRGHGLSQRPPTGYDVATAVDDLIGVLDATGMDDPVHLAGNSYGGLIALNTALRRPDRVASLILLESQCLDPECLADPNDTAYQGGWVEEIANTLNMAALSLATQPVPGTANGLWTRKDARMRAATDALLNTTTLIDDVTTGPLPTPADLMTVTCPVLALFGGRSTLAPTRAVLAASLPYCTVEVIPDAAHSLLREAPNAVADAIVRYLAVMQPAGVRGGDEAAVR